MQLTPEQLDKLIWAILAGGFGIMGTVIGVILSFILQGKLERDKDRKASAGLILSDASKYITEVYSELLIFVPLALRYRLGDFTKASFTLFQEPLKKHEKNIVFVLKLYILNDEKMSNLAGRFAFLFGYLNQK